MEGLFTPQRKGSTSAFQAGRVGTHNCVPTCHRTPSAVTGSFDRMRSISDLEGDSTIQCSGRSTSDYIIISSTTMTTLCSRAREERRHVNPIKEKCNRLHYLCATGDTTLVQPGSPRISGLVSFPVLAADQRHARPAECKFSHIRASVFEIFHSNHDHPLCHLQDSDYNSACKRTKSSL